MLLKIINTSKQGLIVKYMFIILGNGCRPNRLAAQSSSVHMLSFVIIGYETMKGPSSIFDTFRD